MKNITKQKMPEIIISFLKNLLKLAQWFVGRIRESVLGFDFLIETEFYFFLQISHQPLKISKTQEGAEHPQ